MQPDLVNAVDGKLTTLLMGKETLEQRSNVQQLADRLDIVSHGLTLSAAKGQRVVFGCSSRIRHTLAPDGSSLTFASKGDLIHHWLCCINYEIDRDWMWDALQNRSFVIRRTKRFTRSQSARGIQRGGGRHRARTHRVVRSAARSAAQLHEDRVHRRRRAEEAGSPRTLPSRTFQTRSR